MVNFCSFLWGVAFGSSVMYQVSPRFYNPVRKNIVIPTIDQFKQPEINGWKICSTLFSGIKQSVKEY